jgi:hypothetical protein
MPKLKDPTVSFENALRVTEDPAASGWLKSALVEAHKPGTLSMLPEMLRYSIKF